MTLRTYVEDAIKEMIDDDEWKRCERTQTAERKSVNEFIANWKRADGRNGHQP